MIISRQYNSFIHLTSFYLWNLKCMQKDIWSDEEDMVLIQAHKEVGNR